MAFCRGEHLYLTCLHAAADLQFWDQQAHEGIKALRWPGLSLPTKLFSSTTMENEDRAIALAHWPN